jgi:hypothetical protein
VSDNSGSLESICLSPKVFPPFIVPLWFEKGFPSVLNEKKGASAVFCFEGKVRYTLPKSQIGECRMTKKWSIFLAVLALIASTLACSFGEPTLDNVRTAKDKDGNQPASVFSPTDTVYVVTNLSNGKAGNVVTSKWYAVNVEGIEANLMFDQADISIEDQRFNGNVYFYYPAPEGGWPIGSYKVEIYFNDALISTVEFSVE